MGGIFSLSAESGSSRKAAEQFAKHFHSRSWRLSCGVESKCDAGVFQDNENNWWVRVYPSGVSLGINTPQDAYQMTELGIFLYQHLWYAPDFRYALVGLEVEEFRTYSELMSTNSHVDLDFPGLVLHKKLWQQMIYPPGFQIFALNYFWKPYEGEFYKPLMVSTELKDQLNDLLDIRI